MREQIYNMQVRKDILFRRYLNGEMNQEEYVKRVKALANEYAKPAPLTSTPIPPTVADWLPKTRTPHPEPQRIPIEGFGNYGIPLHPGHETPIPEPQRIPIDWKERRWARWLDPGRAERQAEWLRRRQVPTQALSNYPRLPQSTIPEPRIEYPAPGRPSKYKNPFAWRRKNNGWW